MLEQLREHIHTSDTELLLALLTMLSEVSHNAANVQVTRLAAMGLFHTVLAAASPSSPHRRIATS